MGEGKSSMTELELNKIRDVVQRYESDPNNVLASNVFQMTDFNKLIINNKTLDKMDHIFSHELKKDIEVIDQDQAGLCWMCGGITMCRRSIIEKLKLDDDFHLSLNYLLYWDKLEKANYFLNHIIKHRNLKFDSQKIRDFVEHPISDGGYWHTFADLVAKYGMVPNSVYQRRLPGKNTSSMNKLIRYKLREFAACVLSPNRIDESGHVHKPSLEQIMILKDTFIGHIAIILTQMLGTPLFPSSIFDWTYKTKKGKKVVVKSLTPKTFYADRCNIDFKSFVPIVNDPRPRHPYGKMYEKDSANQMVLSRSKKDIKPHVLMNMKIDDMVQLIMKQIDSGIPVYFSCDVDKFANHRYNTLDIDIYDIDTPFGTSFKHMSKADRLDFCDSYACHIMSIVGYDVSDEHYDPCDSIESDSVSNPSDPESNTGSDLDSDTDYVPHVRSYNKKRKHSTNNNPMKNPNLRSVKQRLTERGNKKTPTKNSKTLDDKSQISKHHTEKFYKEKSAKVVKFKVENSWGKIGDNDGFYLMTREWFNEFGYEIVIDKKHLSVEQISVLKTKPIMMKSTDPLGSCVEEKDKQIIDML